MQKKFDVIIIGRGIVGLATAMALLRRAPNSKIAILEKEKELAFHQTGHNSGVIHSGVYYKPGSLKARNCVAGNSKIIEFCRRHDIAVDICGKLIVATNEPEVVSLHKLWHRGRENGVENLTLVDSGGIRKIEPNCTGIAALHVKSAGITDYRAISLKMADLIQAQGGTILTDEEVKSVDIRPDIVVLKTARREIQGSIIINCAGLFSDRVARMCGTKSHARIVPFRGEYYKLRKERTELIRNLIYPVPDSRFPLSGSAFHAPYRWDSHRRPKRRPRFQTGRLSQNGCQPERSGRSCVVPGFLAARFEILVLRPQRNVPFVQ